MAAVAVATVVATAPPAFAAVAMTLGTTLGSSAGGYTIIATTPTSTTSAGKFPTTVAVEFQGGATTSPTCSALYTTPNSTSTIAAAGVSYLGTYKLGITVPNLGSSLPKWSICAYTNATAAGTLIANAAFTATTPPTITSIFPTAGSAQGGTVVTVTGTGFPAATVTCNTTTSPPLTVTIGGVPLTNLVCLGNTSFQATTPAHIASGPLALGVSTSANGTAVAKANAFSFSNGIDISLDTAANTALGGVAIDVQGVGFGQIDFNADTPNDTDGHIYLVNGQYNPTPMTVTSPVSITNNKTVGQTSECINVLPVADTEVICTLQIATSFNLPMTNTPSTAGASRTITDGVTTATTAFTSATANFTAADVGLPLTETDTTTHVETVAHVAAHTFIAAVTNSTTIVMSQNLASAGTALTLAIGGPRTVADGVTTTTTVFTSATANFTAADVGLPLVEIGSVTHVAAHTFISAVTNSTTIVMSQNLASAGTALNVRIGGSRSVGDIVTSASSPTITSATANFTSADVGLPIVEPGTTPGHIAVSTTILSVTNSTTAVLSANAAGAGIAGSFTALIGGPRAVATVVATPASTAITFPASTITAADIGRTVTGLGIPAGTTIASVSTTLAGTLSKPAGVGATTGTLWLANGTPVPVGTYTLTVVNSGAVNAQAAVAPSTLFTQSVVSSGSTFTVADY